MTQLAQQDNLQFCQHFKKKVHTVNLRNEWENAREVMDARHIADK